MTASSAGDAAIHEVNRADPEDSRRGRSKAMKHPEPQQQQADRAQRHRDGVIAGYATMIAGDAQRAFASLEVFIDVRLNGSPPSALREVADTVHMTGPYDALVHTYVPDTAASGAFLGRLKRECGSGHTHTRVALKSWNQPQLSGTEARPCATTSRGGVSRTVRR